MELVRKVLTEQQVIPSDLRYDPTGDTMQFSPDGGTTWVDAPERDPRSAGSYRLPPLTGDARCDAAARMTAQIEQQVNNAIAFQSAAGIASTFLFGLGLLTVGISTLVGLFLLIADTMISIGIASIISAMTSDVYEQLTCILYTHLDTNGQLQNDALDDVRSDVDAQIGGVAAVVLNLMFDGFGAVNLSNAAVLRSETGDCGDCDDWCFTFDFTLDDGGFTPVTINGCTASYSPGVGWIASKGGGCAPGTGQSVTCAIGITFASSFIRHVVVVTDQQGRTVGNRTAFAYDPVANLYDLVTLNVGDGVPLGADLVRNADMTQFQGWCLNNAPSGVTQSNGTAIVKQITFYGTGDCPFGTPNCSG